VGKGSQDDFNDAKIWPEPEIEVARPGRTLKRHALGQALKVILDTFAPGNGQLTKRCGIFSIQCIALAFILWIAESL
jgi:hypothetical protein